MLSMKDENVREIFDYWVKVMVKPRAKLIITRSTKIKGRLLEGYTVEEIKMAIDGCSKTAWNMGQNPTGTLYNDITLICRSGDKLESYMDNNTIITPTTSLTTSTRDTSLEEDLAWAPNVVGITDRSDSNN